jgi:hypothetical protein
MGGGCGPLGSVRNWRPGCLIWLRTFEFGYQKPQLLDLSPDHLRFHYLILTLQNKVKLSNPVIRIPD